MKKFLKFELNGKWMLAFAVLGAIAFMIPVWYLGKYMAPVADDYIYGLYTHNAWTNNHNIFEVLHYAWYKAREEWWSYQGTYSSIFFMALVPSVFSDKLYAITPILMSLMISIGLVSFVYNFFVLFTADREALKSDKKALTNQKVFSLFVGVILSLTAVEKLHTHCQGLYWYNGSVHYIFMTGIMFLMLTFLMRAITADKNWKMIVDLIFSVVFIFGTAGSNFATALVGAVLFASLIAIGFLYKRKRTFFTIPLFIAYGVGFYFNAGAYGNTRRMNEYTGMNPVDSILNSFKSAFTRSLSWIDLFFILVLILLIPSIWNISKKSKFNFKFFPLLLIYTICIVAASFVPSYYGMGFEGLARTMNVSKILLELFLVLDVWGICGFINQVLMKKGIDFTMKHYILYYVGVIALLVLVFKSIDTNSKIFKYATYGAIFFMEKTDDAERYRQQYEARLEIIQNSGPNVELPEYTIKPGYLYMDDISTDPNDWRNTAMASFYWKESFVLIPTETSN